MSRCTIRVEHLSQDRVPHGQQPTFEIDLGPNEEVIDFQTGAITREFRSTVDHYAVVRILTRTPEAPR